MADSVTSFKQFSGDQLSVLILRLRASIFYSGKETAYENCGMLFLDFTLWDFFQENRLSLLKRHSRFIHFCQAPLLFHPNNQKKQEEKSKEIVSKQDEKTGVSLPMKSDFLSSFLHFAWKHLRNLSFNVHCLSIRTSLIVIWVCIPRYTFE